MTGIVADGQRRRYQDGGVETATSDLRLDDPVTRTTSDYTVVHMGLRAPRVAIVIDGGDRWIDSSRLALFAATRCWGGAGFVLVPHRAGAVDPLLLRMVGAYDPDHVVNLLPTLGQSAWLQPDRLSPVVLVAVTVISGPTGTAVAGSTVIRPRQQSPITLRYHNGYM